MEKRDTVDSGKGRSVVGGGGSSPMAMMTSIRSVGEGDMDVRSILRTAETILRLLPMALCLSALVVFGACEWYLCWLFLLSAVVVAVPRPSTMFRAWTFFFLDQVLTYVILGAGTVSAEVLYLANKGDTDITWSKACGSFGEFCHKATTSVVVTFAAVACYMAVSLVSSYKLFSRYDAPVTYLGDKGIQIPTFHA
ncbi:hypothetical protein K2173_001475 [Erythroxylum novogranatense]|uniref:CASP-like protein n=1 Tax=Erythroxylum novogranatense TaxID=1862640 RepID=A0AAV8U825_9ROSI|nr:hypothetical protein K2173_001475 [Erythroxylum novogranatense]